MNPGAVRVAVLDDEARYRLAIGRLLKTHGFHVEAFETGHALLGALKVKSFDYLLLDLQMPGMTGLDVLAALSTDARRPHTIVITGHDEPENAGRVRALGAEGYLMKPVDEEVLLEALRGAGAKAG